MQKRFFEKIWVEVGNLSNLANWIKIHGDNGQKTYEKIRENWIQMRQVFLAAWVVVGPFTKMVEVRSSYKTQCERALGHLILASKWSQVGAKLDQDWRS